MGPQSSPRLSNVILPGPPGVGKTHIAVGLGLKAIENGGGAYRHR